MILDDFKAIDDSEIEDFHAVLAASGLESQDFDLREKLGELCQTRSGFVFRRAWAVITSKGTGKTRRYQAGDDATTWVVEFSEDLSAGAYR